MISDETGRKTEDYSVSEENLDTDAKLAAVQCPFTWSRNWVLRRHDDERAEIYLERHSQHFQLIVDRQDYFPELVLLDHLMQAFEKVMRNELRSAMQQLDRAEESLGDIEQKGILKNVENVLRHIFIATKCHALKEQRKLAEVDKLLKDICDVKDMNDAELAMLSGCHCAAALRYSTDHQERINPAKRAVQYEPGNGKWHFVLGKVCRKWRREAGNLQKPDEQETSAFEEAYMLSQNALFGVSLAQLYRESQAHERAIEIYKKVHSLKPTSCMIRLQLALGFIRAQEHALAKECLDYVAEKMPDSVRNEHYMAIYEEKCNKNLEAALPHYQRTTEQLNAVAECEYMSCRKRVEPDWDPLPYLLNLLKKYGGYQAHIIHNINIQIGSYYLFEMKDVLSACTYLTEAIKIRPNSELLKAHLTLFRKSARANLYHTLAKKVEIALQNDAGKYNDDEIKVLNETLQLCRENCKGLPSRSESSRTQAPRSQSSKSYGNYRQSSSSHLNYNWRENRPNM